MSIITFLLQPIPLHPVQSYIQVQARYFTQEPTQSNSPSGRRYDRLTFHNTATEMNPHHTAAFTERDTTRQVAKGHLNSPLARAGITSSLVIKRLQSMHFGSFSVFVII